MSMPAHWYYKRDYIQEGFKGWMIGYHDAPHPHPESFMVGNGYHPKLNHYASKVQRIKIKGSELTKCYAEYQGPGNIPKDEMWKIHTEFSDKSLDLDYLMDTYTEDAILGTVFTTGCYIEHSLPVLMYLFYRYKFDFKACILANTNA